MAMSAATTTASWSSGRFDARARPQRLLFGRMYEDSAIELTAFPPGGRIFCIASAGCTAIALARRNDVTAVDINPAQLAYVQSRLDGEMPRVGDAERVVSFFRVAGRLAGWTPARLRDFLALDDPSLQSIYWRQRLDNRRYRLGLRMLFSKPFLRAAYSKALVDCLPADFGTVLRARMERCFARHPNRVNPHAQALLLGAAPERQTHSAGLSLQLFHADAAEFLERQPAASFDGFALSNILDGAGKEYKRRLHAAVKNAAAPDAVVVQRSFREPAPGANPGQAAEDRSMLWGVVETIPARELD